MKTFSTFAVGVLTLLIAVLALQAENRTWTQATSGRTIQGEFVKVEGENVHIRQPGGGVIPVPMKMLSKEDQEFITAQSAPAEPTTDAGEPMTVELHEMHLCCGACERGVEKAVAEMEGVTVDVARKEGLVTMSAPNQKSAQDAINALADAGYYGKSDSHDVDFKGANVKGDNVETITVTGVHLCCKGCVTAADKAISAVDGVEGHTAASKAESFEVTGDFSPSEVLRNLRKAGMNGVVTGAKE